MKTNFKTILFCTALLALPLGCQKGMDTQDKGTVSGDGFEVMVREVLKGADNTKTYLTEDSEIAWSDDDTVRVIGKTTTEMKVVPVGNDATHGFLTKITDDMPEPATSGYTALYPASMFPTATATTIKGTLPTEYTARQSLMNPLKCFPMYAQSSDKVLEFKSVCGLLEIGLTGVTTVTEIVVSTTSTTAHLAGDFTITPGATEEITLDGVEDTVKINCGTDGITLNRVAPAKFYIPLVPGTYDAIKVAVKTKEFEEKGGACVHTTASMDIKKNTVHVSQFPAERNAVQLWAGGPYWSICNLGATAPEKFGEFYFWGDTQVRYTNTPHVDGEGFTFPAGGFETGFTYESYRQIDDWNTAPTQPTASSVFEKYSAPGCTLTAEDDAAAVNWGDGWRIPNSEDLTGLVDNCDFEWLTDYEGTNVAGALIKSKIDPDKSIFVPASGFGKNFATAGTNQVNIVSSTKNLTNVGRVIFCNFSATLEAHISNIWDFYGAPIIRPVHD